MGQKGKCAYPHNWVDQWKDRHCLLRKRIDYRQFILLSLQAYSLPHSTSKHTPPNLQPHSPPILYNALTTSCARPHPLLYHEAYCPYAPWHLEWPHAEISIPTMFWACHQDPTALSNGESTKQSTQCWSITYKSGAYHHHNAMHSNIIMQAHLHIHLHSTLHIINDINSTDYMATLEIENIVREKRNWWERVVLAGEA
jgi:hypothetical protein